MSQAKEERRATNSSPESHGTDLISKLPMRETPSEPLFLYKNFWFRRIFLERIMLLEATFKARHDDIILATNPKCGTTWLKALSFAITNRSHYDSESISIQGCRIVYICRDPKDAFVSRWHFMSEFFGEKPDINVGFNMFCEGVLGYGPYWDHCLEYWRESVIKSDRILFLKYEEMMLEPVKFVKVLASFLGAPFTGEEEDAGVPEEVVRLCSFKTLSGANSSQTEVVQRGSVVVKKSAYFRRGKVGDWVNHISEEMGRKLDDIVQEKLKGSGLVF
ncbi:hypothetical protein SETIT_8G177100v2 [Setaria italica]|uniref:Sulfotransferase n=1 Tax=Setaria italica TaxID=4555 RepID=A0A368S8Y6_SETIT|nr:hypothetical protein SETIT_8G177100v2 [Setaria italica]